MGLKGDLTTFSLGDIFQTLTLSQKEGTLFVTNGDRRKTIHFSRGGLRLLQFGARSTPRLGDLLVQSGAITSSHLESALQHQRETKKLLGESLVELGLLSLDQIERTVRHQVEEEVYDLFWWKDATFEFQEGPPPPELSNPNWPITSIALDVNALLFEAARRLDEWARMVKVIADFQEVYATGARARGAIKNGQITDPAEIEVLELADASRTVLEINAASKLGRFETCRILYSAISDGKVFPAATDELRDAAERLRAAGEKDRALRLARRAVDRSPEDLASVKLTGMLQIETGDLAGAVATLCSAADLADRSGNPAAGVLLLEQALRCDPNHTAVQLALFRRYSALAQREKAGKCGMQLAHSLISGQRWREAADLIHEVVPFVSDPLDLHILHARALLETQDREGATSAMAAAYHSCTQVESARRKVIEQRVQALAPNVQGLVTLAKDTKLLRRKKKKKAGKIPGWLVPAAIAGGAVLLLGLGAYFLIPRKDPDAAVQPTQPSEEELRRKAEAERIVREKAEEERRLREQEEKDRQLREENERRAREEKERREREAREAQEKAARDEAERKALAAHQAAFRAATTVEVDGPDLEAARKSFEDIAVWAGSKGHAELETQARNHVQAVDRVLAEARRLAESIAAERTAGNVEEAYRLVHRLWKDHPHTASARGALLPIRVITYPPGAKIKFGKVEVGRSPAVLSLAFESPPAIVWIEIPGFLPTKSDVTPTSPPALTFHLEKVVAWRFRTRGPVEAQPAVVGRRAFVASRDGHLYAVGLDKGEAEWTFACDPGGDIVSWPVAHGDSLYFGSNDHRLYRVGLDDGKEKWRYEAGLFVQGTPLVLDDPAVVVVGGHDNRLHAVKRDTGEPLWTSAPVEGPVAARPFLHGGHILFGADDGKLRAVDPAKGKPAWELDCGSEIVAPPLAEGDRAWIATQGGKLHAIDLAGRRIEWSAEAPGGVVAAPALTAEAVLVGTSAGQVIAFARADGKPRWSFLAEGPVTGGLAVDSGRVYFGAKDGNLYVLDAGSGALLWKLKTRAAVNGVPRIHDGLLLVGSDDGQLYAIDVR